MKKKAMLHAVINIAVYAPTQFLDIDADESKKFPDFFPHVICDPAKRHLCRNIISKPISS
jgi:hypothetical protein